MVLEYCAGGDLRQILSMDASTRAWLERAYATDMPANREMVVEPTPVYRNDPPAWNKFFPGGEEDSLQASVPEIMTVEPVGDIRVVVEVWLLLIQSDTWKRNSLMLPGSLSA